MEDERMSKKRYTVEEIIAKLRRDAWRIVIPDHHDGYISANQFVVNRGRPAANRTNCEGLAGPVRAGLCLLQSLLLCSACGRRLGIR
jgi:hypothetical protein